MAKTDGIVLIDELDLHLHPKWQRRVIRDLKNLFPRIQFITTTHSPQLVGEALPDEVRILAEGTVSTPSRSFGIDSSRILSEVMHVSPRNSEVEEALRRLSGLVDTEDLEEAKGSAFGSRETAWQRRSGGHWREHPYPSSRIHSMRSITKVAEPARLTEYRSKPDSTYEGFPRKDELRACLAAEQKGLCCYCLSRIRPDAASMKIEHWRSQAGYPADQLRYSTCSVFARETKGNRVVNSTVTPIKESKI